MHEHINTTLRGNDVSREEGKRKTRTCFLFLFFLKLPFYDFFLIAFGQFNSCVRFIVYEVYSKKEQYIPICYINKVF